jgi:serine/threonine protein kinase/Tfp pilus assembly protein PilF
MTCCLNPSCKNPPSAQDLNTCPECGIELVVLENRYRPLKAIGRGGFGKTYLAEDIKKFGEQCVIKQFAPYSGNDSETERTRFQDEAKQLQRLGEHPQIPTLLAFFTERGYLYFVQQYVAGENLAEELDRRGVFDEVRIRNFLEDLLGILQVVHQQGVIHRDIKPYNIMRRKSDDKLVLIDFGISKQLEANPSTGTSIGSLGYSPLEQFWGGKAYPSSDLYSLGVTAFYLISGSSPHEILAIAMEETSPAHAHNWAEHWRKYVKQPISDNLGGVMDKLMHIDHKHRYQSANDVLWDLQQGNLDLVSTRVQQYQPKQPIQPIQLAQTIQAIQPIQPTQLAQPMQPLAEAIVPALSHDRPKRSIWYTLKWIVGGSFGLFVLAIVILLNIPNIPTKSPTGEVSNDLGVQTENAYAYLERGKTRSAADNLKGALADFNQAVELQSTAESYSERGQVKDKLKDKQGALADFEAGLKLNPSSAEIYYYRASVYDDLNNNQAALADLNKSLDLNQNNSLALIARGRLYEKLNNKTQALADLNAAIKIDNRSSYAYMSRAGLFASQNKRTEAIADYDRSIVLDPTGSIYEYYQRGILHQELNHQAQARADFQTTLQLAKKAGTEKDYADATVRLQQLK